MPTERLGVAPVTVAVSVDDGEGVPIDRDAVAVELWLAVRTEAVRVSECEGVTGSVKVELCEGDTVFALRLRDIVDVIEPPE